MRPTLLLAMSLLVFGSLNAQEIQEKPEIRPVSYYIGLQPGVRPLLFNDWNQYAWDINMIPLTIEYAIDRRWALRVHPIWEIEIRPENFPTVLATAGVELAAPFHLALKNSEEGHRGFYVAPVLTPGYNVQNEYFQLGMGAEAGFALLFGNRWSFTISAQAGFLMQKFPAERFVRYVPYSIPVVGIGLWL